MLEIAPTTADDATLRRLKTMSETLWEKQGTIPDVNKWLANFDGKTGQHSADVERLHAAHLLSHFTYFGKREVEELLVALYRDLFRYELIQQIRQESGGGADAAFLRNEYDKKLRQTRFFGVGGPSESGTMLLYPFRQQNKLDEKLFPDPYQLLTARGDNPIGRIADSTVERLVFIDDVLGTGTQAVDYSTTFIQRAQAAAAHDGVKLEVWYLTLFAMPDGLEAVRALQFDRVDAVHVLTASQRAFSDESHVYADSPPGIDRMVGRRVAERYGVEVAPGHSLGFGNGELVLGLNHNVPDHTLPIFWASNTVVRWHPIFRRYAKDPEA